MTEGDEDEDGDIWEVGSGVPEHLLVLRGEWTAAGLSTMPADRPRAEAGARRAYRVAGARAPDRVLWLDSPVQGAVAVGLLLGAEGDRWWEELRATARGEALWPVVSSLRVGLTGRQEVCSPVLGLTDFGSAGLELSRFLEHHTLRTLTGAVPGWVDGHVRAAWGPHPKKLLVTEAFAGVDAGPEVRSAVARMLGQWEAGDLAYLALAARILGDDRDDPRGCPQVLRSCAAWWPLRDVSVFAERPRRLRRDGFSRGHPPGTAAAEFPDGSVLPAREGADAAG